MNRKSLLALSALLSGIVAPSSQATSVKFSPHEVFRIPFGTQREALGTAVENGNFQYPRDFTLDSAGRVYIFDIKKHRIARYSADGRYEIGFTYPSTAQRVFAHPDSHDNLWLIVSDPMRGVYYGVYDAHGKTLRDGVFEQFNQFRTYPDDDGVIHAILSSSKKGTTSRNFVFHEASLLLKPVAIAPPPEDHHQLRNNDRTYFIDAVPGSAPPGTPTVQRITDTSRRAIAEIRGDVVYITAQGEIYTRTGNCLIHVYSAEGALESRVTLAGLPSSCQAVRFDADGTIYQLDGIPNASLQYTPEMTGMRLIRWERR